MPSNKPSYRAMIAGLHSDGMSYREIAQKTGVPRSTLWRIANDTKSDHLTATVERFAKSYRKNFPPLGRKQV